MGKESIEFVAQRTRRSSFGSILVVCLLAALVFWNGSSLSTFHSTPQECPSSTPTNEEFDWSTSKPQPELKWKSCYGDKECTRLQVPLDYHNSSVGHAAIALLRVPAKKKGKHYKGPILFNPGGPGGSGTGFIMGMGNLFQQVVGEEYDIIGFDPRGVGYTTPIISAFKSDLDRGAYMLQHLDAPFIDDTPFALSQILARSKLLNGMLKSRTEDVIRHSNTAVVCRDMLSIVEAHGEEKLRYWGFSYGSALGASFASLYPDRVERIVIDGVLDVEDYYKGLWSNNLIKADAGFQTVFDQCFEAGVECPLYLESHTSPAQIQERYEAILSAVEKTPVVVQKGDKSMVITKKYLYSITFAFLYTPYTNMKPYFTALKDIESGDGEKLYDLIPGFIHKLECECAHPGWLEKSEGTPPAVYCQDGLPVKEDLDALWEYYETMKGMEGGRWADFWANLRFACVGWDIRPAWEWRGPIGGNTSFPLLLVGNTEDPVTPWAEKMAEKFVDSVALIQESAGHCSFAASSECTARAVRDYFKDGILPAKGTKCQIENHMFLNMTTRMEDSMEMKSVEVQELMKAWRELHKEGIFERVPRIW